MFALFLFHIVEAERRALLWRFFFCLVSRKLQWNGRSRKKPGFDVFMLKEACENDHNEFCCEWCHRHKGFECEYRSSFHSLRSICMPNYGALHLTSTDIMPASAYLFRDSIQRKTHDSEGSWGGDVVFHIVGRTPRLNRRSCLSIKHCWFLSFIELHHPLFPRIHFASIANRAFPQRSLLQLD